MKKNLTQNTTGHTMKYKRSLKRAVSTMVALTMAMSTFTFPTSMTVKAADPVGTIKITEKDNESNLAEPQGDGSFKGATYQIINHSGDRINWKGVYYDDEAPIATITTIYDVNDKTYSADIEGLPYGTYGVKEVDTPVGYKSTMADQDVTINEEKIYPVIVNQTVMKGGVSITKVDADSLESKPQGDATLEGVEYEIVNKSPNGVFFNNHTIKPNEVVTTITTAYDAASQTYVATTGANKLAYGSYEIRESKASTGYTKSEETYPFSITNDGQMHFFDNAGDIETDLEVHHGWNANRVIRGDVLVGKRDRDTAQYINLGGAHLDGAIFEIVNKSAQPVYVNGEAFEVDDVVLTIAADEIKQDNGTIYAALSGDKMLPYGNYSVREVSAGDGYLYDRQSKAWKQDFRVREDGEVVEITSPEIAAYNKVMREDFHFIKKTENGDALANIPFIVESMTTGEKHVIVVDETGSWGSANTNHTDKTNANDPTSPITNGALAVNDKGEWYVADASKLDSEAGTWFTGFAEDKVTWKEDGKSYSVADYKDLELAVNDASRAFPYDTYKVQELRCEANANYDLVNFTVQLHRYSKDHDGEGIDLDFGTITDKWVAIATTLTDKNGKKVVQTSEKSKLIDEVLYENLDVNHNFKLLGELHLVDADGKDEGVVATAEKEFTTKTSINTVKVEFELDTTTMGGKKLVAFETLMDGDDKIVSHEDLEDEDQTVLVPMITTTLTGDLDHMSNPCADKVKLQDVITYEGINQGETYEVTDTLVNAETGKPITDKDGKEVTVTVDFVATEAKGTVNANFDFVPDDTLAGTAVVAVTTFKVDGEEYLVHKDLTNKDQTVYFPKVVNNVTDKIDSNKSIAEDIKQTVQDVIDVTALADDYGYTLYGELYVIDLDGTNGGKLLDENGKAYTAQVSWEGNTPTQTLVFENVDTSKIGGRNLAVVPTLYGKRLENKKTEDTQGAEEAPTTDNKNDTDKTDKTDDDADPDAENGGMQTAGLDDNNAAATNGLVDFFKNVTGALFGGADDKQDDKAADDKDAVVNPQPTLDGIPEADKDQVLLYSSLDTTEADLVHVPHIDTVFTTTDGAHSMQIKDEKELVLIDKVSCVNVIPGEEFIINGSIHTQKIEGDKVTDAGVLQLDKGSSEISYKFVPEAATETVDVTYTFTGDLAKLKGQTITAFENLTSGEKSLAKHEDITDVDQTISFPAITAETVASNGLHVVQTSDKVTAISTVNYNGLVPGTKYTLTGDLHVQDNGSDVTLASKAPVVEFTPKAANGTETIAFTFDGTSLDGKTVVAFNKISQNDVLVASCEDLKDEAQAVHLANITTKATFADGAKKMTLPKDETTVTVKDIVTYTNLIPGQECVVTGDLHVRSTGKKKLTDEGTLANADGSAVTGTAKFTPTAPNGTVEVTFTFSSKGLRGNTLVVFETVSIGGKEVLTHKDIADDEQAISFAGKKTKATKTKSNTDKKNSKNKKKSSKGSTASSTTKTSKKAKAGKEVVKTGQISHYIFFGLLGFVLMAGAGFMYFRKKI